MNVKKSQKFKSQLCKDSKLLTLFRMDLFGAAGGWRGKKAKVWDAYPTMMKLGTVTPYLKEIQQIYESRDTPLEFYWHQHSFTENQQILLYQEIVSNNAKGHKNEHFLPPDTHRFFFGKFGVLCFFETPDLRIALLLYYRRNADIDCILIHNFDFF